MKWAEIAVSTASDGVEIVCGALMELGVNGVIINDDYALRVSLEQDENSWDYADEKLLAAQKGAAEIVFYVSPDDADILPNLRRSLLALKQEDFGVDLGSLEITLKNVDDGGWLENWKNFYKPFKIGGRTIVKPVWHKEEIPFATPNDVVFTIDPGHVFGTGLHQSTRLCARALERRVKPGDGVFDVGTGSGILAVTALLLGAGRAVGCDIDAACAKNAAENAALNGVSDKFSAFVGNLITDEAFRADIYGKAGKSDIVTANIVADVIIALAPIIRPFIKVGGLFIASGIIRERESETCEALAVRGLLVEDVTREDEWVCITASLSELPL